MKLPNSALTGGQAVLIRGATPRDLNAIGRLLSKRDGREWDPASVSWFLCGLDPSRCDAWIAQDAQEVVALSSTYLRCLIARNEALVVGYWANLFIDPAYRAQMLYPRLPLAMGAALQSKGVDVLYAAVRLRHLADVHERIGFKRIGRWHVLYRPLRPLRLGLKYCRCPRRVIGVFSSLIGAIDGVRLRHRSRFNVQGFGIESDCSREFVRLLNAQPGKVYHQWTNAEFLSRFARTREGDSYRMFAVGGRTELQACVMCRVADRDHGVRIGVVMSLVTTSSDTQALNDALRNAESWCRERGADVMIVLDGQGPQISQFLQKSGYRKTKETYDLMVWPSTAVSRRPGLEVFGDWRMSFADHDAF